MPKKDKTIEWSELKNWWPIMAGIVAIVLTYGILLTRVTVLESKVDLLLASQEKLLQKYSNVETRYGDLTLKVRNLETLQGIK